MNSSAGVVWITGASSGIGAELARQMADDGWQVAVSARRADSLAAVADHERQRIHAYPLDVTDAVACQQTAAAIAQALGPIDLAVLNAGISKAFDIAHVSGSTAADVMTVNYLGAVNGIAAVLPAMRERSTGHIAMTASVAGYRGLPRSAYYAASKAAVISLAESLQIDLVGSNVAVTVINPGYVKTPLLDDTERSRPFLVPVDQAVRIIRRGLARRQFEIAFPWQMAGLLKLLQRLPYALYFPLIRRLI